MIGAFLVNLQNEKYLKAIALPNVELQPECIMWQNSSGKRILQC